MLVARRHEIEVSADKNCMRCFAQFVDVQLYETYIFIVVPSYIVDFCVIVIRGAIDDDTL